MDEGNDRINIELISGTIIGLKTYEAEMDEEKVKKYIAFVRGDKDPSVNIWKFLIALVLLAINLIGKGLKNDY